MNAWNWFDILGFVSFGLIFVNTQAPFLAEEIELFVKIFSIFQMLLKVNYFLRVYEEFGLLVNLI
jgi:hypothetical protein